MLNRVVGNSGVPGSASPRSDGGTAGHNSPWERFARAYAQYITRKGGAAKIRAEVEDQIKASHEEFNEYPYQWKDDEFAPIEKAFDEMFRKKGWLK